MELTVYTKSVSRFIWAWTRPPAQTDLGYADYLARVADPLWPYRLKGVGRLSVHYGHDSPDSDDECGPGYQDKDHAANALIAVNATFVSDERWASAMKSSIDMHEYRRDHGSEEERRVAAAASPAWEQIPVSAVSLVYLAANEWWPQDSIEATVRVASADIARFVEWLDRAMLHPHLLPSLSMRDVYFRPSANSKGYVRYPLWSDFLTMRAPLCCPTCMVTFVSSKVLAADAVEGTTAGQSSWQTADGETRTGSEP